MAAGTGSATRQGAVVGEGHAVDASAGGRQLAARLDDALAQQAATAEILRVIRRSPTSAAPVFETIAGAALRLCHANSVMVATFDGRLIHVGAVASVTPAGAEALRVLFPRPPSRDYGVTRAVLEREVVSIPDLHEDADYGAPDAVLASGFRSVLAVPLMHEGAPIGAISVGRAEAGAFTGSEVGLLRTFADQAVIAIENVRLLRAVETRNHELAASFEREAATSGILRVISRSRADVQPVFDAICQAALRLCGAASANVFTFDGALVRLAAMVNVNPAYGPLLAASFPQPLSTGLGVTRAILARDVAVIPDVLADAGYATSAQSVVGGFRSVLAVPLMLHGEPIGALVVGRPEPGTFPDEQAAMLRVFADQAVIAIENVRMFSEVSARTAELTRSVDELRALGEVGQAVGSSLDLATVLSTIVARATALTGMDGGTVYEYDEASAQFHLHTADRLPDDLVAALRAHPIRRGEGLLGQMALAGEPVQVADIVDAATYRSRVRDALIGHGYRSLLAVPLWRGDRLLGGLAVNRRTPGAFAPDVVALLETFAAQSAIAIQNARLYRELELKGRLLEQASRHKSEFLANMSHELRTPLNAIIGFSEVLAERMFGEINAKQAEYLDDILGSARHLLSLINDILDLAKIEAGRLELDAGDVDVAAMIRTTLALVRERAQRREIALACDVDDGVGTILADERKLKQVLLNLLSNALKFTPERGRVTVRAAPLGDDVEIAVSDTGVGIAPEDQASVFEEFRQVGAAQAKSEGTGLGLAITRRFVELHGGWIRVASALGEGATFIVRLPRSPGTAGRSRSTA